MFFSFDGIDGVGKSTQMRLFVEWLCDSGLEVVTCRDPGSTSLGESLREILLHSEEDFPIGARAEMLMYMAARAQLVEEVIRPALDRDVVVVSDRFLLANIAYQAHAGGLDREEVADVGAVAIDGVTPDLVFLLDLPPSEAERRRGRAADRMESRGESYRECLRQGFLSEAQRDPTQIALLDAARSIEEIQADIQRLAAAVLA